MKRNIEPIGYAYGRVLSKEEIEQISGAGNTTGTASVSGGGVPGPITASGDADIDYEF